MISSNNNSEIDVDSTYTKYGQCRCCTARGQHRDVDKEYYCNNIKEVYRDIFVKCYNLSLSPHNLISPLICEDCVHRLRDASSFRMMVAASEELLLNTVIFKSDPENDTEFVDMPQNFTTEVKIENNLDIINMIPSPDVFQDELEDNKQVNDEGWVNDNERTNDDVPLNYKERTNDDVPLNDNERMNDNVPLNDKERTNDDVRLNDKERTNDNVPLNDKERTNDDVRLNDIERTNDNVPLNDKNGTNDDVPLNDKERTNDTVPLNDKERTNDDVLLNDKERTNSDERVNDEERMNDDGWSDGFDNPMNDDDGWGDGFGNPMNDDDGWSDVFDDPMNEDIRLKDNEITSDDVPLNDKERVNDDDGWSDVFVDPTNDDDDWTTDTDNELVIDEDRESISSGTDVILTDEDLDECGSIFNSTITRSETSSVDDEPSPMVQGEKKLLSKATPVQPLPKRRQLVKICPKFNEHLKNLQYKTVEPKTIEWFFKTKTPKTKEPKEKDKSERGKKIKLSDNQQALKPSITENLVEPKTILSPKQALAASIPNKLVKQTSIQPVSKTKTPKTKETITILSDKQALEPCITEKLVESKTILSDNRALAASIPEKLVESKTILSDKQALQAILIISIPDKVVESKTILSDKRSLVTSIPGKRVELKTILSDKQALPASIPDNLVEQISIERVSKTDSPKTRTKSSEKQALAVDATTLFEFSNATAFKNKNRNGYPCFYCREVYKYNRLKEHQENKHPKGSIYSLLAKYYADDFVIYAEITDLKCTICKKDIKDLYELREHLSKKHGKKMHKTPDRVIPFKLQETDFECQICGRIFDTFVLIEKHMNTHFGTFVCKTCGMAFITKHRLAVHTYSSHKNDKIKCKVCKKSFATYMKMRVHYEGVHEKNKTIQCTKCPEKFIDHFSRMKHLADAHGGARHLYQCDECEKGFARRSGLHDHVNRCHMPEIDKKKMKCDKCSFNCYTKSELRDHKLTHGGAQTFDCDICNKVYNRRRSLAMHLKTHMTNGLE